MSKLTLRELSALIFGQFSNRINSEYVPTVPIQSMQPGDLATVKVVFRKTGETLRLLDPNELEFHVEVFDKHAEVWLAPEWKESNARRSRLKEHFVAISREREKRIEMKKAIVEVLENHRFENGVPVPDRFVQEWSTSIAMANDITEYHDLLKGLQLFEAVTAVTKRYE